MNRTIPQELMNIPFGQVIILTSSTKGIINRDITLIRFISTMADQYEKEVIVNALPVEYPWLCHCAACKVETDDGVQVLVADKDSLIEMLCVFWGLNYGDVCQTLRRMPIWAHLEDGHLIKTPVPHNADLGVGQPQVMQQLKVNTKEESLDQIRSILQDIFNHNTGISFADWQRLYREVKDQERKSYKLDFKFEWKDNFIGEKKIDKCFISLIDDKGKKYPFGNEKNITAQVCALYFTFILFKEGLALKDLEYNEDFYKTFMKILSTFLRGYEKPTPKTLHKQATSKRSVIKRAIEEAIGKDNYTIEQFSIEGFNKDVFQVRGATDDDRALIRKVFSLE